MLAYIGLGWAYVGVCWPYVEPSWGLCWGYVGYIGPMLGICEAIYVEKIFRDNLYDFFLPAKQKPGKNLRFLHRPDEILGHRGAPNPVKHEVFEHRTHKPL